MNFFTKNKVIAGVIGVLAIVSVVNTQAILKLTNSVWGNTTNQSISLDGQNQSAQTINFSAKITEGEVYKRGDKSQDILEVQKILAAQGLYNGAISGLIGPKTESAIMDFQKANGLKVTGVLDQNTVDAILKNRDIRPTTNTVSTIIPECNRGSEPWIMVTSPNGGEVYQAGQQINVTWAKCNVPASVDVGITLLNEVSGQPLPTFVNHVQIEQTPNDGSQIINTSAMQGLSPFEYGNRFKVMLNYVVTNSYDWQTYGNNPTWMQNADESNNSFTITDEGCAEGTIIGYDANGNPIYCGDGEVGCAEGTVIGYNPDGTPIYCGGIYNGCAEGTIIGYTQDGTPLYCGGAPGPIDCAEGTIIGYDANGPIYCQGGGEGECSPGTVIGYDANGPIYCQ